MNDEITPEVFKHLVELAALDMTPEQAEYLRRELNNQLKAIHELEAIPFDKSIPPSSHGVAYTPDTSPKIRADVWIPYENPASIIGQAPQSADNYIVVPEIPHTTLE